jgi:hypothetical protein
MNIHVVWTLVALLFSIASLGGATNLLVKALQKPVKKKEGDAPTFNHDDPDSQLVINAPRIWAWISVLVFVFFGSTIVVLELLPFVSPISSSSGTSDLVSLSMGLIGLVITALTGMALSSAWRAKDQAEEAKIAASDALKEVVRRDRDFHASSVLQLARIEALELKLKFTGGPKYRLQATLANLLATAFAASSDKERIAILSRIAQDEKLYRAFTRYGLDGAGIYDYLMLLSRSDEMSKHDRRNILKLLT